jgi:hypothetical protein
LATWKEKLAHSQRPPKPQFPSFQVVGPLNCADSGSSL